ncbi:MAG: acetolactate decarboxylase [Thermoguttaceae bacterium]|nr:acetolactate decarboxylase [Thermoguttaceae bacterium]
MRETSSGQVRFVTLCLLFFALAAGLPAEEPRTEARLTQVATIDSLLSGCYDGWISLEEFLSYGDFGLGTVDRINGELTILDGVPYQSLFDGTTVVAARDLKLPFASVVPFDPVGAIVMNIDSPSTEDEITERIDTLFPNQNRPLAIRIEGDFTDLRARSEVGQNKPYRPLAETMKDAERRFELGTLSGTVVGFRTPSLMKGLNIPGYHYHFIDSSKQIGGHLLQFSVTSGKGTVLPIDEFLLILPELPSELDLERDRSEELNAVEKGR